IALHLFLGTEIKRSTDIDEKHDGQFALLLKHLHIRTVKTGILIPMGELSEKRIARADEAVHTGDEVSVKILHIDKKRKRISLSITKAAHDAENEG
ncbi:MAG: S1 RNA-binding domain-containing protein, partial [Schwartzia succinivorans]|nr:S1 RNA-binding domain-containing protein [Schwartzia succinivorans]